MTNQTAGPVRPVHRAPRPRFAAAPGRRWWLLVAAVTAIALAVSGCLPRRPIPRPGPLDRPVFATAGPYAAGVTTLELSDRKVEVWYPVPRWRTHGRTPDTYYIRDFLPAALQAIIPPAINPPFETDAYRDLRPAYGRFPLVVFSHGAVSFRLQSTFLTSHLASWGFVVASPDFLERGLQNLFQPPLPNPRTNVDVLTETVARLRRAGAEPGLLHGIVGTGGVAAVGHSAGGAASTQFAATDDVLGWVPLAAGSGGGATLPAKPSMWIAGADDTIVPATASRAGYDRSAPPTRYVEIGGAGHLNAFSDLCLIGEGGGGIIALAKQAGLPVPPELERLGTDGCFPPALASERVWPVTRHFVTAALRQIFRIDRAPVGLADGVQHRFGDVPVVYEQRLR